MAPKILRVQDEYRNTCKTKKRSQSESPITWLCAGYLRAAYSDNICPPASTDNSLSSISSRVRAKESASHIPKFNPIEDRRCHQIGLKVLLDAMNILTLTTGRRVNVGCVANQNNMAWRAVRKSNFLRLCNPYSISWNMIGFNYLHCPLSPKMLRPLGKGRPNIRFIWSLGRNFTRLGECTEDHPPWGETFPITFCICFERNQEEYISIPKVGRHAVFKEATWSRFLQDNVSIDDIDSLLKCRGIPWFAVWAASLWVPKAYTCYISNLKSIILISRSLWIRWVDLLVSKLHLPPSENHLHQWHM